MISDRDNMDITDILRHIDVFRAFSESPFSTLSTAEIEERLGLSHHPTFRKLKILESAGLLIKQKGGYSLNLQNELVVEIMRFISNIQKLESKSKSKHDKAKSR